MAIRSKDKERYWALRKEGKCVKCKGPADGKSRCRPCADEYNRKCNVTPEGKERRHQYYMRRKLNHICITCGKKHKGKMVRCKACNKAYNEGRDNVAIAEKNRIRYQEKKWKGICVKCPTPAIPGYVRCASCMTKSYTKE